MTLGRRRIIDAHLHLWNLDENYYPWLSDGDRPSLVGDYSSLRRNYVVADLLRDIGDLDVIAGVHIQAEHDHADPVRETRWLQRVADSAGSRGFPQAIVADADFAAPNVAELLDAHCAFPNMRGIRHALHRQLDAPEAYDPLEDPAWHRNFPLLAERGLSFDMQLFPIQAESAARLIGNNPDVPVIITHAGMPIFPGPENAERWRRAIRLYARYPNVSVKISGFGSHDPHWGARRIDPVVSEIMAAFGVERSMLASNYPVERLAKPYSEVWSIFADYFSSYSEDEKEALFWKNAARIYRIDLATTAAHHGITP